MRIEEVKGEEVVRGVKFADVNKQNDLEDYKAQVEAGDYYEKECFVKQRIFVTQDEWDNITNSFLQDLDWWKEIGGHDLGTFDRARFKNFFPKEDVKASYWDLTPEAQKFFKDNVKALTTELINEETGEKIYINTEGFKYARYVGVLRTQPLKGMTVSIYTSKDGGDCSNGGISSRAKRVFLATDIPEMQIFEAQPEDEIVVIKKKNVCGNDYIYATPEKDSDSFGWMMGGSYIYACDSRFSRNISKYPVPLHDRRE
jgi:hypothetical protein